MGLTYDDLIPSQLSVGGMPITQYSLHRMTSVHSCVIPYILAARHDVSVNVELTVWDTQVVLRMRATSQIRFVTPSIAIRCQTGHGG